MYKLRLRDWQVRRNKRKQAQRPVAATPQPAMTNWRHADDSGFVQASGAPVNTQVLPLACDLPHVTQANDVSIRLTSNSLPKNTASASGVTPSTSQDIITTPNSTCIPTPSGSISSRGAQQAGTVPDDLRGGNPIVADWQVHSNSTYHQDQHNSVWYSPDSISDWIATASYCPLTPPTVSADPGEFINLYLLSCTLNFERCHEAAHQVAAQAFKIYGLLIEQNHRHALTSLNAVMIILLDYTRGEQAINLVFRARKTAAERLKINHPLVRTIDYMLRQARGDYTTTQVNQMREVYNSFCTRLSPRHPHSLVAGYELAWRMAVPGEDKTDWQEALGLLDKIKTDSDGTLGATHMHSISILMTKSRVLRDLREFPNALEVISEAMDRIKGAFLPKHPYLLEAKTWYAPLLFKAYRDDEAGREWVDAALGRVELLGREHALSKKSIEAAEDFFYTTERQSQAVEFVAQLNEAEIRYRQGKSVLECPPVHLSEGQVE